MRNDNKEKPGTVMTNCSTHITTSKNSSNRAQRDNNKYQDIYFELMVHFYIAISQQGSMLTCPSPKIVAKGLENKNEI